MRTFAVRVELNVSAYAKLASISAGRALWGWAVAPWLPLRLDNHLDRIPGLGDELEA